jgi:polar amino acid transport system permease protein
VAAFVIALCRVSPVAAVRVVSGGVVQLVQGTPLLVILFLAYFGLPAIGFSVPPLLAAGASLTVYVGAFLGEVWRGAILAVPRPQWEAAECLALSRTQRMFRVVLPQAMRIATPPTVGFLVQIVKSTSLASAIGFVELARAGQIINNSVLEPFRVYVIIAAVYFVICYPLSRASRRLERRGGFAQAAAP